MIEKTNSSHANPAVAAHIREHKDKETDIEEVYHVTELLTYGTWQDIANVEFSSPSSRKFLHAATP